MEIERCLHAAQLPNGKTSLGTHSMATRHPTPNPNPTQCNLCRAHISSPSPSPSSPTEHSAHSSPSSSAASSSPMVTMLSCRWHSRRWSRWRSCRFAQRIVPDRVGFAVYDVFSRSSQAWELKSSITILKSSQGLIYRGRTHAPR